MMKYFSPFLVLCLLFSLATPSSLLAFEIISHKDLEQYQWYQIEVTRGDTMSSILSELNIPAAQRQQVQDLLRKNVQLQSLKIGTRFEFLLVESKSPQVVPWAMVPDQTPDAMEELLDNRQTAIENLMVQVSTNIEREYRLVIKRYLFNHFKMEKTAIKYRKEYRFKRMRIDQTLFGAMAENNVPIDVLDSVIDTFSYDIDFQRDIVEGTEFELCYPEFRTTDGELSHFGPTIYAALYLPNQDRRIEVFRFKDEVDGDYRYFDKSGSFMRKTLMKTPINARRLRVSSRFGLRRHPILGYSKFHKGVDFGAPHGAPILAAGDGRVIFRNWKGGYGKYLVLQHHNGLRTAYGHMSNFGRFAAGARVRQGDVIGYVGSTGMSTGPHLHYEIMIGGTQINPLKFKNPPSRRLQGEQLTEFQAHVDRTYKFMEKVKISQNQDQDQDQG